MTNYLMSIVIGFSIVYTKTHPQDHIKEAPYVLSIFLHHEPQVVLRKRQWPSLEREEKT
jgi:hypothetical protein